MIVRVRLKFYFVEARPIDRIFRKADLPGRISYGDADAFVPTGVPPTFSTLSGVFHREALTSIAE